MDKLELGWLILMTSSFVTAQQGDSANEEAKNIVDRVLQLFFLTANKVN